MAQQKTCFVISPIGDADSDIRKHANDVYDLVIEPALEKYNFHVWRADKKYSGTDIKEEMIADIHDCDLCIVLLTGFNPNVMYEFGLRHETGKPFILLLDSKEMNNNPFDTASLKTFPYDISDPRSIRNVQKMIGERVEYEFDANYRPASKATLSSLSAVLDRIEGKLDALRKGGGSSGQPGIVPPVGGGNDSVYENPEMAFKIALRKKDIPTLEALLPVIQVRKDEQTFYDYYVEMAAARGSRMAGSMMKEYMQTFLANATSFKMKDDYLSCYVQYVTMTDQEEEEYDDLIERLSALLDEAETDEQKGHVYNQMNRLAWGAYCSTERSTYLDAALHYVKQAVDYDPKEPSYLYNYASLLRKNNDLEEAIVQIKNMLAIGTKDGTHLRIACELLNEANDPLYEDTLQQLAEVDPIQYQYYLLENR